MSHIGHALGPAVRPLLIALVASMTLAGPPSFGQAAGETPVASPRLDNRKVVTIPVEGMVCLSCAATVKRTVKALEGVSEVEVGLLRGTVRVTYVPGRLSPDGVVSAINRIGYKAGTPLEAP